VSANANSMQAANLDTVGLVFDLDTFAVHDGPGIRLAVYLKGCPLHCQWCHSPESQRPEPELILARERCVGCGACVAVCPQGAQRLEDGQRTLDRALCRACGRCVEVCVSGALALRGYSMQAREVVERAQRLQPFFAHSGGGVTLTGGEVTMQPDFAEAVLAGCQAAGIHTALETTGACSWSVLERLAAHADLLLYDLKLMNDSAHRRWVGASNRQILENAARLAGYNVQIRVPLIPGITDTDANMGAIVQFMRAAGLRSIALLPYNAAAGAKYEWLDQPYQIEGTPQSLEELERLLGMARDAGLEARIS
jgi:pyruvate formate lyase activating enzyme